MCGLTFLGSGWGVPRGQGQQLRLQQRIVFVVVVVAIADDRGVLHVGYVEETVLQTQTDKDSLQLTSTHADRSAFLTCDSPPLVFVRGGFVSFLRPNIVVKLHN